MNTTPLESPGAEPPSLLVEHSGGAVLAAPAVFVLFSAGFVLAFLRPEGSPSRLTYLGLLALLAIFVTWVRLFYSSPRRIEVKAGRVTVLYFGGAKREYSLEQLSWRRPTAWFDSMFGLESIAVSQELTHFRVWNDMANSKAFLNMLAHKRAV